MFNYRSMSDVELLNAYREILVAKRRQILWRAMENHNAAEKKIPNPGADHEKLAVLSSGSSCCAELHDIQMKIAAPRRSGDRGGEAAPRHDQSRLISPGDSAVCVKALTPRFPRRIYSADRTDPRRMRHDCGVDPDLRGGVRALRGRRGARSDQALMGPPAGARGHRLDAGDRAAA